MASERGMTIAESVVAFGLMAVLAVVVIGVFSKLLVSSAKSTDLTAGQLLAKSVLDRAARQGPDQWGVGGSTTNFGGGAQLYAHDKTTGTRFVYEVLPVRLNTDIMGNLYEVTVTVTWWRDQVDPEAGRQQVGRLSTQLSRTVYVKK